MCWNKFNAADDEEDIEVGHAGEAELDEIPTGNIHQIQLFQEITAEVWPWEAWPPMAL